MIKTLQSLFYNGGSADKNSGILIISPENRRYFTAFESSDGFLCISKDDCVFFTDSRYIEEAERTVKYSRCEEQKNIFEQISEFFSHSGVNEVFIENSRITVKQFNDLQKNVNGISICSSAFLDDCISAMRCIKSREETECIITAQRIAEDAFSHILNFIEAGKTEKQVQLELDYYMLSHGAEALSFDTIAVSGANSSKPHGVPSDKTIEIGDFLTLDFGAVYKGYHSDMTRTVAIGRASDKQKTVYNTVVEAKNTAEAMIKAGIKASDADKTARDIIEKAGFGDYFRHGTGHGVGIEIHEFPNLSPNSEYILQKGNIVTVEPGIYMPGEFGVRVEDMVLVCGDFCKKLTNAPEELIIL